MTWRSAFCSTASVFQRLALNRAIATLMAAQLVNVAGITAFVTLGGIVGARLAPSAAWATLPVSCMVVGTALATIVAAWAMAKIGRARGFALGALIGCCGHAGAAAAMALGSFALFTGAAGLVGVANAFAQQYRFAAVENARRRHAGHAVSLVLLGSLGGAVIGPILAVRSETWLIGAPFAGGYLVVAAGCLAAACGLLRLPIGTSAPVVPRESARRLTTIVGQPLFLTAVIGAAAAYGAMVFVMTAAPLAMHALDSHALDSAAAVVQAHVVAMYLPSLATGFLIARWGIGRVMACGVAILALTLAAGFAGREVPHYGASMIALGVGWNLLYVGGTVLLGQTHRTEERFRAQAVNDFVVFAVAAAGSLSAGLVLHVWGWLGVLAAAALPIAVAAGALAIGRPGRWPAGLARQ